MENLYSYVFHYNSYTELWSAIPTNRYTDYFANSSNDDGVLKAKEIQVLIDLICKGEDFIKLINL